MKSTSGEHYLALDHIRALAAYLVFSFHFMHGWLGFPVSLGYAPTLFPFSIITQGFTGVALFMTLSGYLFAKLLDGKQVDYPAFFCNRALRLFPLLFLVIFVFGLHTYLTQSPSAFAAYVDKIERGFIEPTLPNGQWSIAVELHFYVLLPIILLLARKSKLALPLIVLAAIVLRAWLHHQRGEIQTLAYLTLIGRVDQFVLGILAFRYRALLAHRHVLFGLGFTAFLLFFWWFNLQGGFAKYPSYPSPSPVWIYLPTIEGLAYALLIGYYDNTYSPRNTGVSKLVGLLGAYSYSIYLLHFFVVHLMAGLVNRFVMGLGNFYVACAWSLICFVALLPVGYLSFRFVESPFLSFRRRYYRADNAPPVTAAG